MRRAGQGGRQPVPLRAVPWLVLAAGLGLATMPAWGVMAFGARVSVEDLLRIRCLPW